MTCPSEHGFGFSTAVELAASKLLPLAYSATARRSASFNEAPCACIFPLVSALRMAPGGNIRKSSLGTARVSSALPGAAAEVCTILRWHTAQIRWKTAAPVPAGAAVALVPAVPAGACAPWARACEAEKATPQRAATTARRAVGIEFPR